MTEKSPEEQNSTEQPQAQNPADEEIVKVVDRKGQVKFMPRAEYEQKKRRRKRREHQKSFPLKEVISIAVILILIVLASYIALNIVK